MSHLHKMLRPVVCQFFSDLVLNEFFKGAAFGSPFFIWARIPGLFAGCQVEMSMLEEPQPVVKVHA